mmetsp:Transcript_43335/g.73931  ORF Transcript_43335/g.73931 Transcript_43335/m.73931 type:complete len:385 (+) Transcript_43335:248-1402(+)|eukprot:CAMPEP_0183761984 /NCGR_PEP_ID=MMETSP0739-20130205/8774_1 /TAXON_ID=385413 /ORGANISM="Thalassiosira miniscula, Strain CCMP1093" /LENGTH=384 /DNA_ID=CAMNT_0026000203 /DNA_START=212 /DNA_END=1366 /DNA_ORIENTATION=+
MDHKDLIKNIAKAIVEADDCSDFDLHQNYDNAIECLLQCNFIIKSLEDQLATKDDAISEQEKQISSLEERIIEMSFELARAKALEDEYRLVQRRMSEASANSKMSAADICQQNQPFMTPCNKHRLIQRHMSEMSANTNMNAADLCQQTPQSHKITLESCLRNGSGSNRSFSEFYKPLPKHQHTSMATPHNSTMARRNRTSTLLQSKCASQASVVSTKSTSSTSTSSISLPGLFRSRQASMRWNSVSRSLQSSFQGSSQGSVICHDDNMNSSTTNRFCQIGHFLLGTNEANDDTATSTQTGRMPRRTSSSGKITLSTLMAMRRSNSDVSSRSSISGVVFPVTSDEILAGCRSKRSNSSFEKRDKTASSRFNECTSRANEEWPEFQ